MKSETYPLALPSELLKEVRKAAKKTGLSMADTMRQSMKLGLPKLVEGLSMEQVLKDLQPMTPRNAENVGRSQTRNLMRSNTIVPRILIRFPNRKNEGLGNIFTVNFNSYE